jgi:hypothetical protein
MNVLPNSGVLWLGEQAIPGSADFVDHLAANGKRIIVLTNNATKSRAVYAKKLASMGYGRCINEVGNWQPKIDKYLPILLPFQHNIVNPAAVVADLIHRSGLAQQDKKVYLIGGQGVKDELALLGIDYFGAGFDPVDEQPAAKGQAFLYDIQLEEEPEKVGAVVVGYEKYFNYLKLMKAANYLQVGARGIPSPIKLPQMKTFSSFPERRLPVPGHQRGRDLPGPQPRHRHPRRRAAGGRRPRGRLRPRAPGSRQAEHPGLRLHLPPVEDQPAAHADGRRQAEHGRQVRPGPWAAGDAGAERLPFGRFPLVGKPKLNLFIYANSGGRHFGSPGAGPSRPGARLLRRLPWRPGAAFRRPAAAEAVRRADGGQGEEQSGRQAIAEDRLCAGMKAQAAAAAAVVLVHVVGEDRRAFREASAGNSLSPIHQFSSPFAIHHPHCQHIFVIGSSL